MDTLNDFIVLVLLVLLVVLGGVELAKYIYHTASWPGVGLAAITVAGVFKLAKGNRKILE
jgi:hypothetical protein